MLQIKVPFRPFRVFQRLWRFRLFSYEFLAYTIKIQYSFSYGQIGHTLHLTQLSDRPTGHIPATDDVWIEYKSERRFSRGRLKIQNQVDHLRKNIKIKMGLFEFLLMLDYIYIKMIL